MKVFQLLHMVSVVALSFPFTVAYAQQTPTAQESTPGTTPTARARGQESLRQITTQLSQATGVRIVADTNLSRQQVTAPQGTVTKDELDDYLTRLARRVSPEVMLLKIYLPTSESGHFTPDAIAQAARAQMELVGRAAPNTVQIQGKVLSSTDAEPLIRTLGLEPVYVLTTRQAPPSGSFVPGASGLAVTADNIVEGLTKQLGVSKVSEVPSGTYKVNLPGPDGVLREATIEVENTAGSTKIHVMQGSNGPKP